MINKELGYQVNTVLSEWGIPVDSEDGLAIRRFAARFWDGLLVASESKLALRGNSLVDERSCQQVINWIEFLENNRLLFDELFPFKREQNILNEILKPKGYGQVTMKNNVEDRRQLFLKKPNGANRKCDSGLAFILYSEFYRNMPKIKQCIAKLVKPKGIFENYFENFLNDYNGSNKFYLNAKSRCFSYSEFNLPKFNKIDEDPTSYRGILEGIKKTAYAHFELEIRTALYCFDLNESLVQKVFEKNVESKTSYGLMLTELPLDAVFITRAEKLVFALKFYFGGSENWPEPNEMLVSEVCELPDKLVTMNLEDY